MARELPVLACRLDLAGLRAQRERYAAIGAAATSFERASRRLAVELGAGADEQLVEETIAVERECCPFFELDWDASARRLSIGVADLAHDAALDAIEHALRG